MSSARSVGAKMRRKTKPRKSRPKPKKAEVSGKTESDIAALVDAITQLSSQVSQIISSDEKNLGLSEWSFLRALAAGRSLRSGQIARRLCVTRQRAAQIASALHKANLIEVQRSDEDNRKKDLTITDEGKSICATLDSRLENLFSEVFAGRPAGATRMRRAVRKLIAAARGAGS
jgi:DNA-binding MarR family transcriptional regulator